MLGTVVFHQGLAVEGITSTPTLQLSILIPALLGLGVSFVTELLTKSAASAGVKAFVNVVLAALAGAAATVIYDPHQAWTVYVLAVLTAWITSLAIHYTGVTGFVQDATAAIGIGTDTTGTQHQIFFPDDDQPMDVDGPTVMGDDAGGTDLDVIYHVLGCLFFLAGIVFFATYVYHH